MKLQNSENTTLINLKKKLEKVEKELSTCRTSVMQDGWQTSKHAKKARKWDILAEEKRTLLAKINDCEHLESLMNVEIFE